METVKRLTLLSRVDIFSGYGQLAVQMIREMTKLGVYVQVRSLGTSEMFGAKVPPEIRERFVPSVQPEDAEVLIHPPNFVPTPGKRTFYLTMWEATRLRKTSVAYLNMAEQVIVPSWWGASCFSAAGVDKPISVVPLGIDPQTFSYRRHLEPRCVFGVAGRMAHGGVRKGINEAIDAFLKAFPTEKDVLLKVKAFPDCPVVDIQDERIVVEKVFFSDAQMSDWLGSLTCFVSLAKSEGWGLIQHQALAVGRPVISIVYAGVAEFLSESNSYPVRFNLAPAQLAYADCGHWAEPNIDDVVDRMRQVYEHRGEAEAKGLDGHRVAHKLTWANTCAQLHQVLTKAGAL